MKKRSLVLLAVAACALVIGGAFFLRAQRAKEERLRQEALAWQQLERGILAKISPFKGEVGMLIEDLSSGRTIMLNQQAPFASASMVKVPIMAAFFEAEATGVCDIGKNFVLCNSSKTGGSGKLKAMPAGTQVSPQELIELMISESDNTAANMLIDSFGFEYLNAAFKRFGLNETTLERKMMDFKDRKNGVENYTTAVDTAKLFRDMYFGRFVSKKTSQKCLAVLKMQKINDRIPRLLPPGVAVAHKTGLEYGVCHDAGVMYTPRGDFLICLLVKHTNPTARAAKRLIASISKEVYDWAIAHHAVPDCLEFCTLGF